MIKDNSGKGKSGKMTNMKRTRMKICNVEKKASENKSMKYVKSKKGNLENDTPEKHPPGIGPVWKWKK